MSAKAGEAGRSLSTRPCVVLVHGLWMHGLVFALMRRRLEARGFATQTFSYPSVGRALDANADALAACIEGIRGQPVHLIGHSLGGCVILRMMALHPGLALGRVVLMGSPLQGSRVAEVLTRFPGVARMLGRSIRDWLILAPPRWPLVAPVGIIAGDRAWGVASLVRSVEKPHDGVVALAETALAGASARTLIRTGHAGMLISARCADAAACFLEWGRFEPLAEVREDRGGFRSHPAGD